MSRKNVEVVRASFQVIGLGDLEILLEGQSQRARD
jgi:hypothetical protein